VRDAEGTSAVRPGVTPGSAWSEGSKNYIRNVEAVGSNPITSTESPGHRADGGISQKCTSSDVTLRDLIVRKLPASR
jgi:hypothetical protein